MKKRQKIFLLIIALFAMIVIAFCIYSQDEAFYRQVVEEYEQSGYTDMPVGVINIKGNPDLLYGESSGIIANWQQTDIVNPFVVQIWDAFGKKIIDEQLGVRVAGNASREYAQKSFAIIPDKKLYKSRSNELCVDLGDGLRSYNRLKIHTGGQDIRKTQMRDQIVALMEKRCGFDVVRPSMPALVYLNGEFYGISHLEPVINESYIAAAYNLDKDKIEVVSVGIEEAIEAMGFDYDKGYDFNDEVTRKKLEEQMDVDDFLYYYAFNMLINNYDWPFNNVFMWRYTGKQKDSLEQTDGRYRFIITDVDVAFMDNASDPMAELNWGETPDFHRFISDILKYQPYRDKFVNDIMDQLSLGFSEDGLCYDIAKVSSEYGDAFRYAADKSSIPEVKDYLMHHEEAMQELIDFALGRKGRIYDYLYQYYDAGEGYRLVVESAADSTIKVSNIVIDKDAGSLETIRACNCDTRIYTEDGTEASWLINGQRVEASEIYVNETNAIDGEIYIEIE